MVPEGSANAHAVGNAGGARFAQRKTGSKSY